MLGELVLLLFVVLKVDVDIVVRAGAEERGEEGEWVSGDIRRLNDATWLKAT